MFDIARSLSHIQQFMRASSFIYRLKVNMEMEHQEQHQHQEQQPIEQAPMDMNVVDDHVNTSHLGVDSMTIPVPVPIQHEHEHVHHQEQHEHLQQIQVEVQDHHDIQVTMQEDQHMQVQEVQEAQEQAQMQQQVVEVPVPEPTSDQHGGDMHGVAEMETVPVETMEISAEALQGEMHNIREANAVLVNQVNALISENSNLKHNININAGQAQVQSQVQVQQQHTHESQSQDSATATAAAAAQLTTYQNALALSESQKQELVNENQVLRQRLIQAGIQVSDVISPVAVTMPGLGQGEQERKMDGDAVIDITEAEALAAIDPQHVHAAHAHGHGQSHPHTPHGQHPHEVHHPNHVVTASMPVPVPMTPNTAGLSSRSEEKWEMHFARLTQYKNEHGNCLVPTSTELGRWLCRQRHNYRYKNLKEERKHRLMELDTTCLGERIADLGYTGTPVDASHTSGKEDGTVADPNGTSTMPPITTAEGMTSSMDQPTHALNTKTKYNQAYESKLHAKWDKFYQQLLAYKEEHGHCNFPTMNGSLGRWISRQRTLYRSQKLKADRYDKLLNIGFAFEDATALVFKGKLDQQWDAMYQKLLEHKEQKGHCFDVPETLPLGKWLYRQRWLYRHGNLRADRAEKLLNVGFEDKKVLKKNGGAGGSSRKKRKREGDEDQTDVINDEEGAEIVGDDAVAAAIAATAEVPAMPAVDVIEGDQPMDQHTVPALDGMQPEVCIEDESAQAQMDAQIQAEAQVKAETQAQMDAQVQAESHAQQVVIEEVVEETVAAVEEQVDEMVAQEASV